MAPGSNVIKRFKKRYVSVFENIRDALLVVDGRGHIRAANAAARAALDLGQSRRLSEAASIEKNFVFEGSRIHDMATGTQPVAGYRLKDAEGNVVDVTVDVLPLDVGKGASQLRLVHIKDFSSEKHYEHWKDELVAMVAHEIKNPLSAMKLSLNALVGSASVARSDDDRLLRTSIRNIDRLTRLLDGLLDTSRIAAGNYAVEPSWIGVGEFLGDVVDSFTTLFNVSPNRIDQRVSREIEQIYADAPKLEQVLINLLSNAVKFSPPDGRVEVTVEPSSLEVLSDDLRILPWRDVVDLRFVRIVVSDHGIGMAEDTLAHLFTRHYRKPGASRAQGSHLGLSIAKALTEAQYGRLDVESQLGLGTEVCLSLPEDRSTLRTLVRLTSLEQRFERLLAAGCTATLYALRKNDSQDWQDVVRNWPVRPVIDPPVGGEGNGPFYLWALSERMAVALYDDCEKSAAVDLFGPNRNGDHAWARGIDEYWIGRSRVPEDGTCASKVIYHALKRMRYPTPAWAKD